jgi:hypothetical protein
MEFNDEIERQWFLTVLTMLALITGFGIAINLLTERQES